MPCFVSRQEYSAAGLPTLAWSYADGRLWAEMYGGSDECLASVSGLTLPGSVPVIFHAEDTVATGLVLAAMLEAARLDSI